ncbi:Na/Pi symporter [Cytobacillus sp. FSL K6-0265]|uniref:Na/Pi symporter n=1 Tax=Cytobacillus sp. FSL K6-0265 TaxID=2921448 RepID=UPI0030F9D702
MTSFLIFIIMIAVFIFGMTLLRKGLFYLSADSTKRWLTKFTNTPLKGMMVGILLTAIMQSSSAVMIITIGLVAVHLLTFRQTIGIILGTNIGTTITTELITFNIESFILPIAIIGMLCALIRRRSFQSIGIGLMGIACVFAAMRGFEHLAFSIKETPWIRDFLITLDQSLFLAVITGIVLTAIIQSSTATTGILMGFLTAGGMDLSTAIAIMLGSNIGTCADAYLASIGGRKEAKLTAYAHIWLNIIGVLLFYPFIEMLTNFGIASTDEIDRQLAHVGVLFNVITSLLVLPFVKPFSDLIIRLHDRKQ